MTNPLFEALQYNDQIGENGMPTHSTSGSAIVDMFFKMGASRQVPAKNLVQLFVNALSEDMLLAVKAMFYNRDVRGGQGERRSFRIFFRYLCVYYPEVARKNLKNVVEYGRWDDLLVGLETPVEDDIYDLFLYGLKAKDKLCAKWLPREGKSMDYFAKLFMAKWKLSPRQYRRLLATHTEVVENLMCNKEWGAINYNHVPSVAINKYRKAWYRNDPERYGAWVDALAKGDKDVKVNAGAIYPHTLVGSVLNNRNQKLDQQTQAQWDALPDYVPEGQSFIPVCDVSGSMGMYDGVPMLVSIALGIYLSERNKGVFKDGFITFSGKPTLQVLKSKSLREKILQLHKAEWGMNTNLEAVFNLLLNKAVESGLSNSDMPQTILILSDMQFDQCVTEPNASAIKMIRRKYEASGYSMPNVVFWNLRDSTGVPVKYNEEGTCLVSGFSPAIMQNLLSGDMTPENIVNNALNNPRYEAVTV